MLYDPDPGVIRALTNGDVPTFKRPEEQRLLLPPERHQSRRMSRGTESARR